MGYCGTLQLWRTRGCVTGCCQDTPFSEALVCDLLILNHLCGTLECVIGCCQDTLLGERQVCNRLLPRYILGLPIGCMSHGLLPGLIVSVGDAGPGARGMQSEWEGERRWER